MPTLHCTPEIIGRDFKQASQCSSEINRHQATKKDLEGQLELLIEKLKAPMDNGLETLRQECDQVQQFVKGEEATLAKEISFAIVDTLAHLDTLAKDFSLADNDTTAAVKEGGTEAQVAGSPTAGQLSRLLLSEIRSEVELFREMSRIRFGREETVPTSSLSSSGGATASGHVSIGDEDQVELQRRKLERSIQAAVVEEDYDTAGTIECLESNLGSAFCKLLITDSLFYLFNDWFVLT